MLHSLPAVPLWEKETIIPYLVGGLLYGIYTCQEKGKLIQTEMEREWQSKCAQLPAWHILGT